MCVQQIYEFPSLSTVAPGLSRQVYTNKKHLLDDVHGGSSDDEDGRGPKMVYFDLKVHTHASLFLPLDIACI